MKNKITVEGAEWRIRQALHNVIQNKEEIDKIIIQAKTKGSVSISQGAFEIKYSNKYGIDHFAVIE